METGEFFPLSWLLGSSGSNLSPTSVKHAGFHKRVFSVQTSRYPPFFFPSWISYSHLKFENLVLVYCVHYYTLFKLHVKIISMCVVQLCPDVSISVRSLSKYQTLCTPLDNLCTHHASTYLGICS